jgi:Trp operon repressor
MADQPELSEAEWTVVVELLERERADLHPEIRHTRTRSLREALRRRLELVEGLLDRVRPLAEPEAEGAE